MASNPRTNWWKLYLTLPAMGGLFLLEGRLVLPRYGHIILELAILAAIYEVVRRWVHANARALWARDLADGRARAFTVIEYRSGPVYEVLEEQPALENCAPPAIRLAGAPRPDSLPVDPASIEILSRN
jgi:hypothetical protein